MSYRVQPASLHHGPGFFIVDGATDQQVPGTGFYTLAGERDATRLCAQLNAAFDAGTEAMAKSDQFVFENTVAKMHLLDDALSAYVRFAATRRTELGSLSPEMEAVDAQAVAALAGMEPQVPGIVAWFRQEQPLGRWVECTPFQPGAVRFSAKAPPNLRALLKPTGSDQ